MLGFAIATSAAPGPNTLMVGVPTAGIWGVLGAGAGRVLRPGRGLRALNIAMAVLMLASLIPALRH